MKIKEEVINRITIPTETTAKLQFNADKLVAAVAAQTFDSMIQNGLEDSYITTGEAFVFLHIEATDPTTLFYHLTIPNDEVHDDDLGFLIPRTAINQNGGISGGGETPEPSWKNMLLITRMFFDVSETERKLTPPSNYKGRRYPISERSPYFTRASAMCNPDEIQISQQRRPDDPDEPPMHRKLGVSNQSQNKAKSEERNSNQSGSTQAQQQYCTQQCLLGIARKLPIDEKCPNVLLHQRHGSRHAIDIANFLEAVQNQLAEDLDHNCTPLGLQGARGALFHVTLASHGYVFVGKGTVQAFVPDLLSEGRVYQQLEQIQGAD
ncbi:hypothetical protein MMC17_004307 [Xylographa soralifera]|nr:hypothetical protein [Xylographa soralifera]